MINLGLSRITALLSQSPTKQTWKAIHIAGTNGKGSVAAYLSSLFLRLSKPSQIDGELKVGRFTSPHLIDRWDCITINDQPVSESLFLRVEREVKSHATAAVSSIQSKRNSKSPKNSSSDDDTETVTEFELLTATAFEIFSQQNCQVAIIECGLGGRLDATNALPPSSVACSVITKIGLDHVGILGDTVSAIAREKAGIVKRKVPMVVDGSNTYDVIESIALIANAQDVAPSLSRTPEVEDTWHISSLTSDPNSPVGQLPPHQYNNLILALSAFTHSQASLNTTLKFTPPSKPSSILPQILTDMRTSYPARLQHLSITGLFPKYSKPILLDGAHNPQSAEVLKSYLDSLSSNPTPSGGKFFRPARPSKSRDPRPRTWIIAMSRGKDTHRMLSSLLEKHDHVVACHFSRVDGMPWVTPLSPAAVARVARGIVEKGTVREASDVVEALQVATETCLARRTEDDESKDKKKKTGAKVTTDDREGEMEIVVAGSLYLASDLLRALRDGPDAVRDRFGGVGVAV